MVKTNYLIYIPYIGIIKLIKNKAGAVMSVKTINDQNFKQETNSGLVVVDFNATWCPPCKMMAPIVQNMANELDGQVSFKAIDVDENQQVAQQMQIQGIPTFIVKKDGQVVDRIVGFTPEPAFKARLAQYMNSWYSRG